MKKRFLAFVFIILTVSLVALSGCGNYGTFYFLTEAYELGLITQEDLLSIAYYCNGGTKNNEELMGEDYEPIPKEPLELSQATTKRICRAIADKKEKESLHNAKYTGNDFRIYGYYGKYGNGYAIWYDYYSDDPDLSEVTGFTSTWREVCGVMIFYNHFDKIEIYIDKE